MVTYLFPKLCDEARRIPAAAQSQLSIVVAEKLPISIFSPDIELKVPILVERVSARLKSLQTLEDSAQQMQHFQRRLALQSVFTLLVLLGVLLQRKCQLPLQLIDSIERQGGRGTVISCFISLPVLNLECCEVLLLLIGKAIEN